ncbi:MAG: NifB/NifX family molybdenum-iron cluster-binding protein [Candidatus Bathyarchaeia archaeon]|jgi:predicted Fe-Mo cluster-binding NifX family protein
MPKRVIIPIEEETGLDSPIAQHFGRAPYFAVIDLDDNHNVLTVKAELNRGEHAGGSGHAHEHLLTLKPNVFVTYGMGLGCLRTLQSFGVTVLKAAGATVKETLEQFKEGKLEPLIGGCLHSHHHDQC